MRSKLQHNTQYNLYDEFFIDSIHLTCSILSFTLSIFDCFISKSVLVVIVVKISKSFLFVLYIVKWPRLYLIDTGQKVH